MAGENTTIGMVLSHCCEFTTVCHQRLGSCKKPTLRQRREADLVRTHNSVSWHTCLLAASLGQRLDSPSHTFAYLFAYLLPLGGLTRSIDNAKTNALSAYTQSRGHRQRYSSMPHYLSVGVDSSAAQRIITAVHAKTHILTITLVGVEQLPLFIINILCLHVRLCDLGTRSWVTRENNLYCRRRIPTY